MIWQYLPFGTTVGEGGSAKLDPIHRHENLGQLCPKQQQEQKSPVASHLKCFLVVFVFVCRAED